VLGEIPELFLVAQALTDVTCDRRDANDIPVAIADRRDRQASHGKEERSRRCSEDRCNTRLAEAPPTFLDAASAAGLAGHHTLAVLHQRVVLL
jgi:hypothetical protein